MAAPAKPKPGRYLGVVAVVLIGLYLGLFLGPAQTPALGLDLRGGTEATLTAHAIGNGKVTKSELNQAVDIIRNRVGGLGVGGNTVTTQGSANIVVSIPGQGRTAVLKAATTTALLRFRQVMAAANPAPTPVTTTTTTPNPSATATTGAGKHGKGAKTSTPSSKPSTKAAKKSKSQGMPLSSALLTSAGTKAPAKKATPTATPSASPDATTTPTPAVSSSPSTGTSGSSGSDIKALPGSESPTLSAAFEKSFASWDCTKHPNPTQGADTPSDYIISCDSTTKYLLAPARVEGTQVTGASAGLDSTSQWVVNLTFNGSGGSAWQSLTKDAYNVDNGTTDLGSCSPPKGCNAVAIVLDGIVQSAPDIITPGGIPGGQAQISGSFTQSTAQDLANVLKYGSLPLKFTTPDVQSVSASLGAAQLRGGLIAGVIGLGLVILFSLLYYRALGIVTVGSLAVSGLILYAVTTLLGHSSVGYTLSLPGIAGFIVAIGITADSFVVFFERLRDEIREGRRLRSGVERAWPRARRTIISADFVSLLAAAVLYLVSIGDVRGFAFTLGLSTLSDLFIVFFFTKPLLSVLARVAAFDSGKGWTGVGKARAGVVRDQAVDYESRGSRRARTREA